MSSTDLSRALARTLIVLIAAAGVIACDSASESWRKMVGGEPNPLLQSQEGRIEVMQRCQARAQARWPMAAAVNFAEGHLTNTDIVGDAEYLGAIEVTSQAGQSQRFRFVCRVQPDGTVDLRYI